MCMMCQWAGKQHSVAAAEGLSFDQLHHVHAFPEVKATIGFKEPATSQVTGMVART